MKKIFLALLLIWTWSAVARAATVTLLSDSVSLAAENWSTGDFHYYDGPTYSGVPSYESVIAYGPGPTYDPSYGYSGAGFYSTPSGVVSWAQTWNVVGMSFLPLPLPFSASADINWQFSVDEQLQIDISFWILSVPDIDSSGSITITDNTTGLAVYSANAVVAQTPPSNSLILQPGTTYDLEVLMSAGNNSPRNQIDLDIAWNASLLPEPMTLMLLGLGAFVLRRKHNSLT